MENTMGYAIVVGTIGIGIMAFGFFPRKKVEVVSNDIFEEKIATDFENRNSKEMTPIQKDMHVLSKKDHDNRSKINSDLFLENATMSQTPPHISNERNNMVVQAVEALPNGNLTLRSDEAALTKEEVRKISDDYANTSWGWLIPGAVAFSDSGKMRLQFVTLFYIASKLKPVIGTDGTIEVRSIYGLEEAVNVANFTGKPFYIEDAEKGVTRLISKAMITEATYSMSVQDLIEDYEKLKNDLKMKSDELQSLKHNPIQKREAVEDLSKIQDALDERDKYKEELIKANAAIVKSKDLILRLTEESRRLQKINLEKEEETRLNKVKTDAITDETEDIINSEIKTPSKINQASMKECSESEFYEMLEKSVAKQVSDNSIEVLAKHTGFFLVDFGEDNESKVFYFEKVKFYSFYKGWAKSKKCKGSAFFSTKSVNILNELEQLFITGDAIAITIRGIDIKVENNIQLVSNEALKNKKDAPRVVKSNQLIAKEKTMTLRDYVQEEKS